MNDDDVVAYLAGEAPEAVDSAERAELDTLRDLLSDQAVWVEPRPGLEDRVVGAVTDAVDTAATSVEDQPASVDGGEVVALRPGWIRYTLLGAAAAVLFVVGLTIGLTHNGNEPVDFQASLAGTDLAPHASGEATMTKTVSGWKIQLHAEGLPRLDNGAYYEAWLKNEKGMLVPIGTFNQPNEVTLWAGVPPSSFPTLTVTRQLANGNPASSGQVVLIGTSHPAD
jgi:Anti-sigma-K factor rskA, C-terminal